MRPHNVTLERLKSDALKNLYGHLQLTISSQISVTFNKINHYVLDQLGKKPLKHSKSYLFVLDLYTIWLKKLSFPIINDF